MGKVEFEDCTKAELIWYIREKCFHTSDDIEFDILMRRMSEIHKKEKEAFKAESDALNAYISLMKPYEGKPIGSVPDSVIHAAVSEDKKRRNAMQRWDKLDKQYRAMSDRTDELLNIKKQ